MPNYEDPQDELIWEPTPTEDVNQEAELLKLLGITPSRKLIQQRLDLGHQRELCFGFELYQEASPLQEVEPLPSVETIEKLVSWALEQEQRITTLILQFLENPSEEDLAILLKVLKKAKLVTEPKKSAKGGSLTQLILRLLKTPKSIDELYSIARVELASNRPEAAVRQSLRRLVRNGTIVKITEATYVLS